MISRPRFRLPLFAALAIVIAAYALRSLLVRGGDFAPDLPGDAIVAVALVVAVAFVAYSRHRESREGSADDEADDKD